MGYGKGKTEGGHKRGHSNSARWVFHQEAKAEARKQRRLASRHMEHSAKKESASPGKPQRRKKRKAGARKAP